MRITTITAGLIGLTMLSACEEPEVILPGERFGTREILQDGETEPVAVNTARAIALPASVNNANWAQSPVSPFARVSHPALGASLRPIFSVNIGAGDSRRERLNVDPVVSGGRIFTMDAEHMVSAVSTSGQMLWQKSMVPARDTAKQAQGGGLAAADGRLYVASGFGLLTALDAAAEGVTSVVWATGYGVDYGWLEVDTFDEGGRPRHLRGISDEPGVYFLGLPWQSRRGSSFIWGVWHDAKHIADHILTQASYFDYNDQACARAGAEAPVKAVAQG